MKTVIEMAREANRYADTHADSTDCDWPLVRDEHFAELVLADNRTRWEHNYEVLMNALWKACGDDAKMVEEIIKSQGELK